MKRALQQEGLQQEMSEFDAKALGLQHEMSEFDAMALALQQERSPELVWSELDAILGIQQERSERDTRVIWSELDVILGMQGMQQEMFELDARARQGQGDSVISGGNRGKSLESHKHLAEGSSRGGQTRKEQLGTEGSSCGGQTRKEQLRTEGKDGLSTMDHECTEEGQSSGERAEEIDEFKYTPGWNR